MSLPSTVYDADGNVIATFQQFDQNIPVAEKDIPQILKDALVASEDKNFYHEGGVDPRGTLRAFVRDLQGQGYLQGGSTITQQYVALAYTGKQRTFTRKLREAILASQLARKLPKDEILYKYLSAVYFGDGLYGVGAAAQGYFHLTNLQQMTIGEAATAGRPHPGAEPVRAAGQPGHRRGAPPDRAAQDVPAALHHPRAVPVLEGRRSCTRRTDPALAKGAPEPPPTTRPSSRRRSTRTSWTTCGATSRSTRASAPTCSTAAACGSRPRSTRSCSSEAQASVGTTLSARASRWRCRWCRSNPRPGTCAPSSAAGTSPRTRPTWPWADASRRRAGVQVLVTATCQTSQVPQGGGTGRQPGSSFKPFVLATAFSHGVLPSTVFNGPQSISCHPGARARACQRHPQRR